MNRFSKLIKTLKEAPTNSMGGVYSLNDPGFRVGQKDRPEKIYPDIDGNFTDGIPGNPGDPFYLRPEGYWNGGNNWTETEIPDASQEYLINDPTGKSTSDLIAEDGTVKTAMPPDSRSFILGPLVDGYVYNHGYDNYSNIGYIQKDTRQFVLLARIQGQFIEGLHPQGGRVWDGTAEQLTVYNSNFTLAMAEWFRDQLTANSFTENVPYFYSGGVPQQPQTPAECPNCPPNMFGGVTPGTNGGFGRGTNPTLGTQQGSSTSGNQLQANIFNLTPDQQRTLMNATMLGLDIVAVLAVLFPEPASSAAGAAILGSKLRYAAKFARAISKFNPFKSSRKPKITYTNRPTKARYKSDPLDKVLRDIDRASAASPPKGSSYTRGDNIRGSYSDVKAQSRPGSGKYKSSSRNYDSKNNPSFGSRRGTRKFNNSYEYETNKILLETINNYLLETATAVPSLSGGGTEVADGYVDKVSETSSPEQLEKASDDANDIATEGGKGLSDADLAKIDQDAEAEAERVTNININNPESLTDDQLFDALNLMYESDPEITIQLLDKYEYLIDSVKLDKEYEKYMKRKDYISSDEFAGNFSPEYAKERDTAQNLWNNYFSRGFDHRHAVFTRDNVPSWWGGRTPEEGQTFEVSSLIWDDTGREFSLSEYQKVRQWSASGRRRDDLYLNKVYPEIKRQRESAKSEYETVSNAIFRPSLLAMIRGWNEFYQGEDTNDDPYSLEGLTPGEIANMSEADKKRLKAYLSKMGVSYGDIANADVMNLGVDATAAVIGLGVAGLVGLYNITTSTATNLINAISTTNSGSDYDAPPGRTRNLNPGEFLGKPGKELTPQQQAEVEAAGNELRDARRALDNLPADATDIQKDMAQERLDRADKNRTRVRNKNKTSNKNRKESYEPRFLKNRERNNLTETRTPKQKRILREIKQPIKVKEAPTKYKMNFEGKYSAQNTPDKTASAQSDALVASGNAKGQKWREQDKYWSGYETTERMNIIHDRVGHGKQAWDMILDEAKEKNGWRSREMQEELNKIAHERAMLKENPDYTSPFGNVEVSTTEKNLQNFDRVTKIKKVVSDKKVFSNKEIKPEYPEDGDDSRKQDMLKKIQQMDYNKEYEGSKAQTGENAAARYKRLDPISADSMPDAAYPQIDQLRNQARKKAK